MTVVSAYTESKKKVEICQHAYSVDKKHFLEIGIQIKAIHQRPMLWLFLIGVCFWVLFVATGLAEYNFSGKKKSFECIIKSMLLDTSICASNIVDEYMPFRRQPDKTPHNEQGYIIFKTKKN